MVFDHAGSFDFDCSGLPGNTPIAGRFATLAAVSCLRPRLIVLLLAVLPIVAIGTISSRAGAGQTGPYRDAEDPERT